MNDHTSNHHPRQLTPHFSQLEETMQEMLHHFSERLNHETTSLAGHIQERQRTRQGLADDYEISLLYERYKTRLDMAQELQELAAAYLRQHCQPQVATPYSSLLHDDTKKAC